MLKNKGMQGFDVKSALLKIVRSDLSVNQKTINAEAEQAEAALYARNAQYAYAYA